MHLIHSIVRRARACISFIPLCAGRFPKQGMKNARIIGTISYRSGPEWEKRFSNKRVDPAAPLSHPHEKGFAPDFHVESYLQHQSDSFSTRYDPNSLVCAPAQEDHEIRGQRVYDSHS
jgi:homoserine acetyltransferase